MSALRALTVCQPFAHLIALGLKPIENREWPTKYRGDLVIHAGKSRDWLGPDDLACYPAMVFGAVVCRVELYDCVPLRNLPPALTGHQHAHGPWCWLLRNVRRCYPREVRGAQGIWTIDPAFVKERG